MSWDAGRRMQRDRGPNRIGIRLRDAMPAQEIAGCVRAVHFETLLRAAVLWGKPQVMERRSGLRTPCIVDAIGISSMCGGTANRGLSEHSSALWARGGYARLTWIDRN